MTEMQQQIKKISDAVCLTDRPHQQPFLSLSTQCIMAAWRGSRFRFIHFIYLFIVSGNTAHRSYIQTHKPTRNRQTQENRQKYIQTPTLPGEPKKNPPYDFC